MVTIPSSTVAIPLEDDPERAVASVNDDDDDDDDDESDEATFGRDCTSSHQCVPGGSSGQCILTEGHIGSHYCGRCGSDFW